MSKLKNQTVNRLLNVNYNSFLTNRNKSKDINNTKNKEKKENFKSFTSSIDKYSDNNE